MTLSTKNLSQTINYFFKNDALLDAALTHRSIRGKNNERLEFLGDSILNFIIAEDLYGRHSKAKEGELSRLRASLVNGNKLADLAKSFSLGDYLRLGTGELKSGGVHRKSILADALEALVGAIYLDSDMNTCRITVLGWYGESLNTLSPQAELKDPKTLLQEFLQQHKYDLPHYTVTATTGRAHCQTFTVECEVKSFSYKTVGTGDTRRLAEQRAAKQFLKKIQAHES